MTTGLLTVILLEYKMGRDPSTLDQGDSLRWLRRLTQDPSLSLLATVPFRLGLQERGTLRRKDSGVTLDSKSEGRDNNPVEEVPVLPFPK